VPQQNPVERLGGRNQLRAVLGENNFLDQRINGWILDADKVTRAGAVRRERHSADYVILVVVVALTAIGILMVYSSSALKNYMSQDADTFATVGPQIQWAILGIVAMALMMRVDYRYLRLASVPFYIVLVAVAGFLGILDAWRGRRFHVWEIASLSRGRSV